jgi:Na+/proline symporter
MNRPTGFFVALGIAACLMAAFTPAAHAQDGLQQMIEKQKAQNQQASERQAATLGIILTVVSVVMVIFFAVMGSALREQQAEAGEAEAGGKKSDLGATRAPGPIPPPSDQELQDGAGI